LLRSLPVDLVKLFLLKTSKAEFIVINNITFNEDNYEQIKQNFGESLLIQIDIIFRTLRLLIEYHWNELNNYRDEEQSKEGFDKGSLAPSSSVEDVHKSNEIIMWNLFDYEDYQNHHKISWNEASITSPKG
jgi:hypothetical protein